MPLTLNQAAKTCGRSKSTLLNAINSGRMSAPKDDRGRYAIDPAELHRAFSFQAPDRSADRFPEPQPTTHENHQTTLTDQGLNGPVTVWCRSFDHVMCSKGDELWAQAGRMNFARMRCGSR